MIVVVMYGMMLSVKIDSCSSVLLENRLISLRSLLVFVLVVRYCLMFGKFMKGVGMLELSW